MNLKTKKVRVGSQALSQQNLCGGVGAKQISANLARSDVDNAIQQAIANVLTEEF